VRVTRTDATEAGAVAVAVAILFPLVLALSAISVNYASLVTERRQLITATDAAALAAAIVRAEGGDADAACRDLLTVNNSAAVAASADCLLQPDGSVFVRTRSTPPFFFLPEGSGLTAEAVATSRAIAGYPTGIYGTRPFGICIDNPELNAYLASGEPGQRDSEARYRIADLNESCDPLLVGAELQRMVDGVVPLNGCGGSGENDLNTFLANGSDCLDSICDLVETRESWGSSNRTQLQSNLVTGRTYAAYILARHTPDRNDAAIAGCSPSEYSGRITFAIVGFVGITIHGTPTVQGNRVSMEVSFSELQVTGPCCAVDDGTGVGGVRTTQLCRPTLDADACTR
jgi:hypothetical protein